MSFVFFLLFFCYFYRAMLRRSRYCYGKVVRSSVSDVEVWWSHRLEFFQNNFTIS